MAELTIADLEAPFRPSFLAWLRATATREGRSYRDQLQIAWRAEGW